MANGYNPYGIANIQQDLLENLLTSEQAIQTGQTAISKQTGELTESFEKDLIAEEKRQKDLLDKKRKKSPLEKLMPLVSLATGAFGLSPIVGGVLSGLTGAYKLDKDRKDYLDKASVLASGTDLGNKWGKTFLGSTARQSQKGTDDIIDQLKKSASSISNMDFLTTGLLEGIQGFTTGQMGANIGDAFTAGKLSKDLTEDQIAALGEEGVTLDDLQSKAVDWKRLFEGYDRDQLQNLLDLQSKGFDFGELGAAKTPILKSIFGKRALGKSPSTLLEEGGEGQNILKNLLMLLTQGKAG